MSDLVKRVRRIGIGSELGATTRDRQTAQEAADRIEELEKKVAKLEARPQPTYAIGGAGNWPFPWGTQVVSGPTMVQHADGQYQETTYAYVAGDNVSRETPKGPNGSAGKTPPDMA